MFKNIYLVIGTNLEVFHRCPDLYLSYRFPWTRHSV